jgi:hypothetical protein
VGIQMLAEEAFSVQEGHTHYRYSQIGGGAQGIPG